MRNKALSWGHEWRRSLGEEEIRSVLLERGENRGRKRLDVSWLFKRLRIRQHRGSADWRGCLALVSEVIQSMREKD